MILENNANGFISILINKGDKIDFSYESGGLFLKKE
ncbi:MAG: hypothetical protein BTN85_0266 [Candidatus Methanohalarchaeum thermophilum]|uniref:Uncharacterized protein n=1 Tax=Methanohalarchaeum thermophilum TaxID=1903181 RepID=A0A1Q6DTX0_METT1|nr:MAG: hypothetical protein BTN85_0266 [Candidatus Methanohalarchaeum thermophilum]